MRVMVFIVSLVLLVSSGSLASDRPAFTRLPHGAGLLDQVTGPHKASRDTVVLMGPWSSGAPYNGQFQDQAGQPAWNGWTSVDYTQPTETHWQLSEYHADNLPGGAGNLAAWCGDIAIVACTEEDAEGGYGNGWNDIIEWRGTVANPTIGVDVSFTAVANIDSEPGYDGTEIVYYDVDGRFAAAYFDGNQPALPINVAFSLAPEDYQGGDDDEVVIQVNFQSDGGWSDADCMWPTAGAVQIDDIVVTLNQGSGDVVSFTDFEDGWGDWAPAFPVGVGDFAQLWTGLEALDPCSINYTPLVAFIDDGEVVAGVGPSLCIDWCYGPGGYIVNTIGGAAGPESHLHNGVESPIMPWPSQDLEGAHVAFDRFEHEDLSADAPGMFWIWGVRSTASADSEDISIDSWHDRNFVYYGGPYYARAGFVVDDLLDPERRFVQIKLAVYELGYAWDWVGNDGYPAPYFDNVRFICYDKIGPGMSVREIDIAQDNFPTIGEVDLVNLQNNSIRFDMARDISLASEPYNLAGDSIVFDIVPVRAGADFVSEPEIVVAMKANPLFDAFRVLPEGFTQTGDLIEGVMAGVPAENAAGPSPDKWAFDLPDENFFFPGDIIHYFIRATDTDGIEEQTATLPVKDQDAEAPAGFHDFSTMLSYPTSYTVRGLPSLSDDPLNPGELVSPRILFWNDADYRSGGQSEWHYALANNGFVLGHDYDVYYTNGPSSGVGNGLGGRATPLHLMDYAVMLYTAGTLGVNTISNGDFNNDAGNDIEVVDSWLRQGDKNLFITGDEVAHDLVVNGGAAASQFATDWLRINYVNWSLRYLINNQSTPLVKAIPGNGVFQDSDDWIAYGGCFGINNFTAVQADVANGGVRLAEFTDPNGATGAYNYSAATLYEDADTGSRVISMPYAFSFIYTNPDADKAPASLPTRSLLLERVLGYFGYEGNPLDVSPVPGADRFAVRNFPNPFNPVTKIEYTMPRAGHLTLKVYNLRGELVKTLIDDHVATSGQVIWDGTNDQGAQVSSGVYFYEARTAGQVQVAKMALVK